jgi:hypothetical protein
MQGAPNLMPRHESSTAMSIVSNASQEPNKTGGISPLSITYDDDFRYRTVSGNLGELGLQLDNLTDLALSQ